MGITSQLKQITGILIVTLLLTPLGFCESKPITKKNRIITIATIGAKPVSIPGDTAPQKIVDRMIAHWKGKLAQVLPDKPDLIVVPEACDRPSGPNSEQMNQYYDVRKDQIQEYFATVAKDNKCYIVYSAKRQMPDGSWRNSSVLIDRSGKVVGIYNKNHPTIGEMEKGILAGRDAPVIQCDFGTVAMAICFDLNFDALRLQYAKAKPDLILFSSMYHGGMMQAYWAYSCRAHFVGSIAGGSTFSEIRDPLGRIISSSTNYFDYTVATVNLDCAVAHLDYNWGHFRDLKKKYGPEVEISDPGCLGSVLITSKHPEITIEQMVEEFEIELLDDYFERALTYREKPGNME